VLDQNESGSESELDEAEPSDESKEILDENESDNEDSNTSRYAINENYKPPSLSTKRKVIDIETAEESEDVPAEPLQEIRNQRVLRRRSKKLKLLKIFQVLS
jgi:hypothetical protein